VQKTLRILTGLFVCAVLAGCKTDDYNVVIKNVGAHSISKAHVTYGGFRSVGGVLPPNIYAGHGHPVHPIPDAATVEWCTEDGQMHRKEVEVKKLVPRRFRGDIHFEIADDNTVTVRVIPREKTRY